MPLPSGSPSPDELRRQALQKVQEAIVALRNYRLLAQSQDPETNRTQLKENNVTLIKEAFAVGASGDACPRCNGSGRV